jgi:predicted hydrocarbon binding protein
MGKPQVPIEVDDYTGVWSVDGMPMILVPQHFFYNNHKAMEEAAGRERYAAFAFKAGHKSAGQWCAKEAQVHGLSAIEVFHHYMKRLSQRGWAQFSVLQADAREGRARVRLDHSMFVLQHHGPPQKACYVFGGWLCGALEWAARELGQDLTLQAQEIQCAAAGHPFCLFEVEPAG